MLIHYLPILILFIFVVGFALTTLLLTHFIGPRRPDPIKNAVYESGIQPKTDARLRFSIKYFLVALIFLLFDIEVVFMYPWAVVYKDMLAAGSFILIEMLVFLGILVFGLIYIWKKGAFVWE